MFTGRVTLFSLLGFEVRVDASWIIIAVLVSWSLASGMFPAYYPDLSTSVYWVMGICGALGLFASIVVHELTHSLAARRYGIEMKGITLFIFGGVAEMGDNPPNPRAEFGMAAAGPLSSLVLGGLFFGLWKTAQSVALPAPLEGVLLYLSVINVTLAVFNLVPAFPLDGGRILRSILWAWKKNLRWATKISSSLGSGFGLFLTLLGILRLFTGNPVGGIWWFLIGIFMINASRMSYEDLLIRTAVQGEPVWTFMRPNPVTVSPGTTLAELVEDYFYRYHFRTFPVVADGNLAGCIGVENVKSVPRAEWGRRTVGEALSACDGNTVIGYDADVLKALSTMNRTGNARLLVVEGNRLLGILSLKDLLSFISLRLNLEEGEDIER